MAAGVKIIVRVRPQLAREMAFDSAVEVLSNQEIVVYKPDQEFASVYDTVLGEQSTQEQTYQHVKDCVTAAMSGYNSTVIAYGQTGTGKTHTMMGQHGMDITEADPETQRHSFGMIPRAMQELFGHAKMLTAQEGCIVNVVASYVEIYNERLYDLLQPYKKGSSRDILDINRRKEMLEVREDAQGNTYVPGLMSVKVKNEQSLLQLIAKGNRNRAVRHTELNINSSRSHALLQIMVEQWPDAGREGKVIRSKLNFVDLAGSERWSTKLDMQSDHIKEMTFINSSLLALGTVVAALSEGKQHVPYRVSKLTYLLQDSLGGNCQTTIIATVSPSADAFEETLSTLKFADRASNLGNNPVVNVSRDMNSVLALKEREIQRLRHMLEKLTSGSPSSDAVAAAMAEFGQPPPAAASSREHLQEELESTRRALVAERALRADLELRLQRSQSAGAHLRTPDAFVPASALSAGSTQYDYLKVETPPTSSGLDEVVPSSSGHGLLRTSGHELFPSVAGGAGRQQGACSGAQRRSTRSSHTRTPSNARTTSPSRKPVSKATSMEAAIQAIRLRIEQLSRMDGKAGKAASPKRTRSTSSSAKGKLIATAYSSEGRSSSRASAGRRQDSARRSSSSILTATNAPVSSEFSSLPSSPAVLPHRQQQQLAGGAFAVPSPGQGWGRSSLLSKFTDAPLQRPPLMSPSSSAAASTILAEPQTTSARSAAQPQELPDSTSMSATAPAMTSGWGRAALLGAGGSGWGRAALVAAPCPPSQQHETELLAESDGGLPSQPVLRQAEPARPSVSSQRSSSVPHQFGRSTASASTPSHSVLGSGGGGQLRSSSNMRGAYYSSSRKSSNPGKPASSSLQTKKAVSSSPLDKGSWIYILGASASSVKAKAIAKSMHSIHDYA